MTKLIHSDSMLPEFSFSGLGHLLTAYSKPAQNYSMGAKATLCWLCTYSQKKKDVFETCYKALIEESFVNSILFHHEISFQIF